MKQCCRLRILGDLRTRCLLRGSHPIHSNGASRWTIDEQSGAITDFDHIYVASKPGWPGYVAIMANDPLDAKATARVLAEWIAQGYTISTTSREESDIGFRTFATERDRRAAAAEILPKGTQESLFQQS